MFYRHHHYWGWGVAAPAWYPTYYAPTYYPVVPTYYLGWGW